MLTLKTACDHCAAALGGDAAAFICSLECTFCAPCNEQLGGICPNCGGDLQRRPSRPQELVEQYAADITPLPEGFALKLDAAVRMLPGTSEQPFAELMRRGTLTVEIFAPRIADTQLPHQQDELYVVVAGNAIFNNNGERTAVEQGDLLFVAAGVPHRFENFSDGFTVWVVFYGPPGGESPS